MMEPTTCTEAEPFALQVKDDSMEPEFQRGCVVVIDPTGYARDGAYVLAEIDGAYLFRRLRIVTDKARLEPLNPSYQNVDLEGGIAVIKGVIVQRAGKRRSYHKRYD